MAGVGEKILAIISIIIGFVMIACGVWSVVEVIRCDFCVWTYLIFACYIIFFGIMVVVLELNGNGQLLDWFGFMRNYGGKGLFFVFVGLFAFGLPLYEYHMEYVLGGLVIAFGLILILVYFISSKHVHYDIIR
eukprot:Phypoly_transcript_25972.p1 GENE.Phypoly_transcript_25972~~Phypoly_transcript_25972.p1  ORF type:complete len:142 (+),score=15.54 Phypoly_transcript_25972:30-428(+)